MAIVELIDEPREINTRNGLKELQKLTVYDNTGRIVISFWGDQIKKHKDLKVKEGDVLLFKSLIVKEFNGKALSCLHSTELIRDIPKNLP